MSTNFIIETKVFEKFNEYSNFVILWLIFFTLLTITRLGYDLYFDNIDKTHELKAKKENLILEEMPGITFILLHSVCWYMSSTYFSKLFFLYWGPLYIVTAYLVVFKKNINWKDVAIPSSIMCKSFYVLFVAIFWYLNMMMPIYCYSVWIMSDQVRLAWFKNNGDRTRRFFEDYFIPRIGYPLFLLLPFFDTSFAAWGESFYLREICMSTSILILTTWLAGIYRLVQNGTFFIQPKIEGFGRDIVYL